LGVGVVGRGGMGWRD